MKRRLTLLGLSLLCGEAVAQEHVESPEQQLAYASEALDELREAAKAVRGRVEKAKSDGDAEVMLCLGTRFTSIRAMVQVSEAAEVELRQAISQNDPERAAHEFRKVSVSRTKVQQLVGEAERCAAPGGLRQGESSTVWTEDSALTGEAGSDTQESALIDPMDLGYDPPQGSPFN